MFRKLNRYILHPLAIGLLHIPLVLGTLAFLCVISLVLLLVAPPLIGITIIFVSIRNGRQIAASRS